MAGHGRVEAHRGDLHAPDTGELGGARHCLYCGVLWRLHPLDVKTRWLHEGEPVPTIDAEYAYPAATVRGDQRTQIGGFIQGDLASMADELATFAQPVDDATVYMSATRHGVARHRSYHDDETCQYALQARTLIARRASIARLMGAKPCTTCTTEASA